MAIDLSRGLRRAAASAAMLFVATTAVPAQPLDMLDADRGAVPILNGIELARYAGYYTMAGPDGTVTTYRVFVEGRRLMVQTSDSPAHTQALVYEGKNSFHVESAPEVKLKFAVSGFAPRMLVVAVER